MSQDTFEAYTKARAAQAIKNEARHIRTKINEARGSPQDAAVRWPFELLQNALDAGPRIGRRTVEVNLSYQQGAFGFEHDGAFFHVQELAALLSGGSSKEFEGGDTTGRFGTGFLVTHVLAPKVRLEGLLVATTRLERFGLLLDRQGDEEAIVRNIEHCNDAIRAAESIEIVDAVPSARFVYETDDEVSLRGGIEAFRRALPYLFATCPQLGRARLHVGDGVPETWEAADIVETPRGHVLVQERAVKVAESGLDFRVVGVCTHERDVSVVTVLERMDATWRVRLPGPGFPRMFCRYPIRTSQFLPINAVLDARFDLDEERRKVLLAKDEVKAVFHAALMSVVPLVELAYNEGWELRHHLAWVAPSPSAFSDEGTEREWLDSELRALADNLAKLQIVETPRGRGAAVAGAAGEWFANFIDPRLSKKTTSKATTIERMWSLVADAENLYPPNAEIARDWSDIAAGWAGLGVDVNLITLEDLVREVRADATELDQLQLRCDRREWLARLLDVVGEFWKRQNAVTKGLLDGLIPNQRARLASGSELRRENQISDELKDIAEAVGVDVRARLVDRQLVETLTRPGFPHAITALTEVVRDELSDEDVVQECVEHLKKVLPDGRKQPEEVEPAITASIRFLDFLWRTRGDAGVQWAKEIPLVSRDGRSIRVASQRFMAPVASWKQEAVPFAEIYPPHRVLADIYAGDASGLPNVVAALASWRMVYLEPLVSQSIGGADLKSDRLKRLLADSIDVDGLVLSETDYSQVALLHEVLPRCQESIELTASLLGMVLTYVAPSDPQWRATRTLTARRGQEQIEVRVRPALWLADILTRSWVPVIDNGGARVVQPDQHALRSLLRPEWLANNEAAINLLTSFFGFGALELRLVSVSTDKHVQAKISDRLARVVMLFGDDVERYGELVMQLAAREQAQRQRERFLNLGRAVQDTVQVTLTTMGLQVVLVDRGYDFQVSYIAVEEGAYQFGAESFLVEVKATTTDRIRMTPAQASKAAHHAEKYVLCVVDLRGLPEERLDQPWSTDDILRLAKVTTDVGDEVRTTWQLIEQARGGTVRISGDESLRYEVPSAIWGSGRSIQEWVKATWGKQDN